MWLWLVTLFFAVAPVHAKQSTFSVDKGSTEWAFDVRWTDGKGKAHRAQFELPADDVTKDLEVPVRFKLGEANKTVAWLSFNDTVFDPSAVIREAPH